MTRVTVESSLIKMCMEGPAVSLLGSPTVSPVMLALCASDPLPPCAPVSMSFLVLSQAPPALLRNSAMRIPDTVPNMSMPERAFTPSKLSPEWVPTMRKKMPTAMGMRTASKPGFTILRSDAALMMSTHRPYSGRADPSMMPGISRNWRRTSLTTSCAVLPTADIAIAAKRYTMAAPRRPPINTSGTDMSTVVNVSPVYAATSY